MILTISIALLIAASTMLVAWFFYLQHKNPGVVDVAWSICITVCGIWYLVGALSSGKAILAGVLLCIWGTRLSGFLWYTRVRPKHIERRYLDIAKDWKVKHEVGFLANFMLQAVLGWIIASPFILLQADSRFQPLAWFGVIIILIGIAGESLADYQLYLFKKDASNKGLICQNGLWFYSRHPNYFFEIVTWTGFALYLLPENYGYISALSPLMLIFIMVFITGPITERVSLSSKGDKFRAYQKTTSMIIPWFKKTK